MPAPRPPTNLAPIRTWIVGDQAATVDAATATNMPISIICLRPYRSPTAPNHSTETASPSE